jgi:hypothetical protein
MHEGFGVKEEDLALGQYMGNVQRPVHIEAELVIGERSDVVSLQRRRIGRIRIICIVVAHPGVGIQYRVLQVFVKAAVEPIAAALGDDPYLSAG